MRISMGGRRNQASRAGSGGLWIARRDSAAAHKVSVAEQKGCMWRRWVHVYGVFPSGRPSVVVSPSTLGARSQLDRTLDRVSCWCRLSAPGAV